MSFYKRNLPHWQPVGAEFFITFRLAESLPAKVIDKLRKQREHFLKKYNESTSGWQPEIRYHVQRKIFQKYEDLIDSSETGPTWLGENKIARIVKEAIHYRDLKEYDLYAYCIMPNHVHIVFKHISKPHGNLESPNQYPVTNILRKLKRFTARECNKILQREGAFWHPESYDRVIRNDDELEKTIAYTLNNPVRAGLVEYWEDWSFNYCKPNFINTFRR